MGILKNLSIFIVAEQFVISNTDLYNTIQFTLRYGSLNVDGIAWIQLFSSVLQIAATSLFAKGVVTKKSIYLLFWLLVNGCFCIALTALYIPSLRDTTLFHDVFKNTSYVISSWILARTILQWIVCGIVYRFYNTAFQDEIDVVTNETSIPKLKTQPFEQFENANRVNADATVYYQPQVPPESIPLYHRYPIPTAPEDSDHEV